MAPSNEDREEVRNEGLFRGTVLTKLEGIESTLTRQDSESLRQWSAIDAVRQDNSTAIKEVRKEVGKVKFYARIANGLLTILNGVAVWVGIRIGK